MDIQSRVVQEFAKKQIKKKTKWYDHRLFWPIFQFVWVILLTIAVYYRGYEYDVDYREHWGMGYAMGFWNMYFAERLYRMIRKKEN